MIPSRRQGGAGGYVVRVPEATANSDERDALLERLREAGVPEWEIAEAETTSRYTGLAVKVALGGHGAHSITAVARASGLPAPVLRDLLQAMGRPNPPSGSHCLTHEDIELAKIVRALLDAGLPRREIIDVARVMGQSTSQIAEALRQLVGDALLKRGDSEEAVALRYARAADELAPLVPALLHLMVRAHLREGLDQELISEAERQDGKLLPTREVAVAFADLAGYTELGNTLDPDALGSIAGRLAEIATTALRPPVRLVKMVGDAAMFVSPQVPAMVDTLVDLHSEVTGCADLPPVRVGMTFGPATARGGDWFGATVNVASRITQSARPGKILVTEDIVERADGHRWKQHRKLKLKGVDGRVRVFSHSVD